MEHWLTKRAYLTPDHPAIELTDGTVISFQVLRERSMTLAKQIPMLEDQSHVAILSDNSLDMVCLFWACTYLKHTVVLLNTKLTPAEWRKQCQDASVSLLITTETYQKEAAHLPVQVLTFSVLKNRPVTARLIHEQIKEQATCNMMFTSGTTGRAKAVQHTYHNHWSSAIASVLNLGLSLNDKWLACLPLFHIGGLSILFKSVIYGMPVYLLERFDVEQVHHAIIRHGVTMLSVVAVTCARLIERLGSENYPDSFRCMLLGGGAAPKALLEKAKQKQIPIIQTYGMTETSSQIVTLHESDALHKLGSAGKPLFSASLEIREGNQSLPAGETGEIVVQGPMITPGYYRQDEVNSKAFQNGWFYTGDVGYVDEDGFLYVVDRRSDLIISGGENIYPAEIEDVLLRYSGIVEAGVTGEPDQQWGKVPVAYVVVRDPAITEQDILTHCRQYLARFKLPKKIYFRDKLPRNAANKLQRHMLQE
ncbi:o-succinylbenzoate--CoA ligase [Gracilibacillus alcaliphilus]|uniref:o-succinylbenzoate--CoA ligase n=1 Tax=Gracilibacillus alcaliphilus TaxID=1401441 RepID=UPI001958CE94|nr:o-succinylbenzoate--CoA ligase [Gracilibacillus alcaliphilus]MBM7675854.1 O-succinylbenzoic acid--CoA ligase [Gracilibacillus alcaliphilus]